MNLIDPKLVGTQILGFLLLLWALRQWAWGPILRGLEQRRTDIAGRFAAADRSKEEAEQLKASYDQKLRGADTEARTRIQEAVTEGQRVAAEIKTQAQTDAAARMERAADDILRENEKAKERLKLQIVGLAIGAAEKVLKQNLDDPAQRKLAAEFIDQAGSLR